MSRNSARRAGLVGGKLPGFCLFVYIFHFPTAGITSVGHHTSSMGWFLGSEFRPSCLQGKCWQAGPASYPLVTFLLPSPKSSFLSQPCSDHARLFYEQSETQQPHKKITSFKSRDLIKKGFSLLFLRSSTISTIFTVWRLWVHYCQSLIYLGRFSQKSW